MEEFPFLPCATWSGFKRLALASRLLRPAALPSGDLPRRACHLLPERALFYPVENFRIRFFSLPPLPPPLPLSALRPPSSLRRASGHTLVASSSFSKTFPGKQAGIVHTHKREIAALQSTTATHTRIRIRRSCLHRGFALWCSAPGESVRPPFFSPPSLSRRQR